VVGAPKSATVVVDGWLNTAAGVVTELVIELTVDKTLDCPNNDVGVVGLAGDCTTVLTAGVGVVVCTSDMGQLQLVQLELNYNYIIF